MKLEVEVYVHHVTEDSEVLRRLDAFQALLIDYGRKLAMLGDDLKTSLTSTEGKQDEAIAAIGTLNTEVKDLISRLQPGDVVTQAMVDLANTVGTKMQAINDALAGIPGEPPVAPPAAPAAPAV